MKIGKQEKMVIVISLILMVLIVGFGSLHLSKKEDPYVSKLPDIQDLMRKVHLIQDPIVIDAQSEISDEVAAYFEGDEEILNDLSIDVSQIDAMTLGSYKMIVKYQDQQWEIPVEVADLSGPEITVNEQSFSFTMKDYSSIYDVMDLVSAKAVDKVDGEVEIDEWITSLPNQAGDVTYTLRAVDLSGNESTLEIIISYLIDTKPPYTPSPSYPEPEVPNIPQEPDVPNVPEEPEVPSEPDIPAEPEVPSEPETPVE